MICTPIRLAFTPVNRLIVRARGLIVAMFSGLVSSGPFLQRGVGNLKLSILCNLGEGLGGFAGAHVLIRVQSAAIRCILIGILFYTTGRGACKNPRGTGVPPVNHGQDARATSDEDGYGKSLGLFRDRTERHPARPVGLLPQPLAALLAVVAVAALEPLHAAVAGGASAGIAFVDTAFAYLRRGRREPGWAALCLFSAAVVFAAMLGVVRISE